MNSPSQGPLTNNTQHAQEKAIHAPAGIEPPIPKSVRPETHALDCPTAGIG